MKQNKSENRNLWLFFFIAFVFSWIFWIPKALIAHNVINLRIQEQKDIGNTY